MFPIDQIRGCTQALIEACFANQIARADNVGGEQRERTSNQDQPNCQADHQLDQRQTLYATAPVKRPRLQIRPQHDEYPLSLPEGEQMDTLPMGETVTCNWPVVLVLETAITAEAAAIARNWS